MSQKTPVQTDAGKVFIITPKPVSPQETQNLQSMIDNAARIEIDGCGKVVKYEHKMADKAEESYKKIIAPKPKVSFWKRLWKRIVSFFKP